MFIKIPVADLFAFVFELFTLKEYDEHSFGFECSLLFCLRLNFLNK